MANYIKSFNFRNGVQVDNGNFMVNEAGRVGIGTTVPDKILDVRGNTKIVGHVTATDASVSGIVTVGSITIDGSTGNIRATNFTGSAGQNFGDQPVVAIATDGFIAGATGLTTTSSVGIGTTNVLAKLDVRGTLGISNTTDTSVRTTITSNANGLLVNHDDNSATILQNQGTERLRITDVGDVGIGTDDPGTKLDVRGSLNVTGITTLGVTTTTDLTAQSLDVSGVSTISTLKVGTAITAESGVITATTFDGNLIGNVTGNVVGVISTTGICTVGTLKVGTAITASGGIITATTFDGTAGTATSLSNSRVFSITGDLEASVISFDGTANVALASTLSSSFSANTSGIVTAATIVGSAGSFGSIGVGTATPSTDIQIRKASGEATLEVISDTDKASISIGNSVGAGTSSASIFFGPDAGFGVYSTDQSFSITNQDTGNFNYFLSNNATSDSGFRWHKGSSNQLMTLTGIGSLGIGITNPQHLLSVQGISTFTGAAHFDSDVTIGGNLDANKIGIGTDSTRCVLDLKESTDNDTGFVLLPSRTTTSRDNISPLIEGALIYNSTNKRLELYNGTAWVGIATEV